ncbi:MAG: DoxX family protein [Flavobacteriaceae bacterium]|nr:DoxX family protein [Flavobacteriaceae bacterium]
MIPEKITFLFILVFFLIVFVQSGTDKAFDFKGNLSFLNDSLGLFFSRTLIVIALISVTILELISGILCLIGIIDFIFNNSNFIGLLGLTIGAVALLVLLLGQRISKNYDGAKTIAIYFILAMMGLALA